MPEILKNKDGNTNWSAIFMGFATALVLIMQQWQTYKIAEIKTQAEVNAANFMARDKVVKIADDLRNEVNYLEQHMLDKGVIMESIKNIEDRVSRLETRVFKKVAK